MTAQTQTPAPTFEHWQGIPNVGGQMNLADGLNRMSADGWELVEVLSTDERTHGDPIEDFDYRKWTEYHVLLRRPARG